MVVVWWVCQDFTFSLFGKTANSLRYLHIERTPLHATDGFGVYFLSDFRTGVAALSMDGHGRQSTIHFLQRLLKVAMRIATHG